jgi:hypothetical protein
MADPTDVEDYWSDRPKREPEPLRTVRVNVLVDGVPIGDPCMMVGVQEAPIFTEIEDQGERIVVGRVTRAEAVNAGFRLLYGGEREDPPSRRELINAAAQDLVDDQQVLYLQHAVLLMDSLNETLLRSGVVYNFEALVDLITDMAVQLGQDVGFVNNVVGSIPPLENPFA